MTKYDIKVRHDVVKIASWGTMGHDAKGAS